MSVRTELHRQSNRSTLMIPQLATTPQTSQTIQTTQLSNPALGEEYVPTRGRRRVKNANADESLPSNTQTYTNSVTDSSTPAAASLRPTFTLPSRRSVSPVTRCQRAATPHSMKMTLTRAPSPKPQQQPMDTRSFYGEAGYVGCKWRHEDYKHQLHLKWLDRG